MKPVDLLWPSAPRCLESADDQVHVFATPLDVPANRLEQLVRTLSDEEWQRAQRFQREQDRIRFVAGRGTLREILGALLREKPTSFLFSYGKFGKPRIAAPAAARSLHFNLAHSDSIAVYATATHELGVDVERIRVLDEAEQITSRYFSPREGNALRTLPAEERPRGFFNCWTRKEAYLKAIGSGLDDRLDQIEVSLASGGAAELLGGHQDLPRWFLHSLIPAEAFVGALAVKQRISRVSCWKWNGLP